MTFRVSLLTIESDSPDPTIMAAIRELLERAGVNGAIVMAPPEPETKGAKAETPAPETRRARPAAKPAHPEPPALACPAFPPCKNCRDGGGDCLVKATEPVIDAGIPEVDAAPAAPTPATIPERPLRVHVPQGDAMPAPDPTGRVDGYPAPPPVAGSLQERIREAVNAAPGVTVPNLAVSLLGNGTSESKRKIDFQAGGLVMSGELMRLNGGLYPKGYRGPTIKAAPATATKARPTAAISNERYYQQILAAFARDNNTPQRDLADKLFGESVGHTVAKLQIMLRQLVAAERLERLGQGTYRPVDDNERRGRGEDEQDGDDEDMESNGASDELEELDVE